MAKHHIHRVVRTFGAAHDNVDQFPTPTKHSSRRKGIPHLSDEKDKRTVKSLYLRSSLEAKSPYTTKPLGGFQRVV